MSFEAIKNGLLGGVILGVGANTLLLGNGNIMGASGHLNSILLKPVSTFKNDAAKYVFCGSFCLAATMWQLFVEPDVMVDTGILKEVPSTIATVLAGALVGFGTKIGSGCTSGHGICGLGRFSKRSLVAVLSFCGVGMITASLVQIFRPSLLLADTGSVATSASDSDISLVITSVATLAGLAAVIKAPKKAPAAAISGGLFAVGLAVSKMIWRSNVIGFLQIGNIADGNYNPALMAVMATGVASSIIGYQLRQSKPVCAPEFSVPTSTVIDTNLTLGAALFGAGWAIGGFCPGPALFAAATGSVDVAFYWLPGFYAGCLAAQQYLKGGAKHEKKQ